MASFIETAIGSICLSEHKEDEINSPVELRKTIKALKLAILNEREIQLEEKESWGKKNQDLEFQLQKLQNDDSQQTLTISQNGHTFDELTKLKQSSSKQMDDSKSQYSIHSPASTKTENLIVNTSQFLSAGFFKYLKTPDNQKDENGDAYDLSFTQKHIKMLRDKLQKKTEDNEKLQKLIDQYEKDLKKHREVESQLNQQVYGNQKHSIIKEAQENQEYDSKLSQYEEQIENLLQQKAQQQEEYVQQIENVQEKLKHYEESCNGLDEMVEKVQQVEEKLKKYEEQLEEKNNEIEELNTQLTENYNEIEELKNQQSQIQQLEQQKEEDINFLKQEQDENISKWQEKYQQMEQQLLDKENQLQEKQNEFQELSQQIKNLKQDNEQQAQKIQEFENSTVEQDLKNEIQNLQTEIQKLNEKISELQESIQEGKNKEEQLQDEIEDLKKISQFSARGNDDDYKTNQSYSQLLEKNINRLNHTIEELKSVIKQKDLQNDQLQGKLRLKDIEIQGKETEVSIKQKEFEFLQFELKDILNSFLSFKVQILKSEYAQPTTYDAAEQMKSRSDIFNEKNNQKSEYNSKVYKGVIYFRINEFGEYIFFYESLNDLVTLRAEDIVRLKPESDGKNTFTITYLQKFYNNAVQKTVSMSKKIPDTVRVSFKCSNSEDYDAIMEKVQDYNKYARLSLEERKQARKAQSNNSDYEEKKSDKANYLSSVLSFFGSDSKKK